VERNGAPTLALPKGRVQQSRRKTRAILPSLRVIALGIARLSAKKCPVPSRRQGGLSGPRRLRRYPLRAAVVTEFGPPRRFVMSVVVGVGFHRVTVAAFQTEHGQHGVINLLDLQLAAALAALAVGQFPERREVLSLVKDRAAPGGPRSR
jgi:hypothetical protein